MCSLSGVSKMIVAPWNNDWDKILRYFRNIALRLLIGGIIASVDVVDSMTLSHKVVRKPFIR